MIEWLIQTADAHPDLARGVPPHGLLGHEELARFAALKSDKRRRDWLLGRWTAKHLLVSYIEQTTGLCPPLDTLVVGSDPDGAPCVEIRDLGNRSGERVQPALRFDFQSLSLSISHSNGHACCALSDAPGVRVGVDIERVDPRPWQFAEDYFTEKELLQVRNAPAEQHELLITAIWSAKEAALKALRLGLSVDTRSVSCAIAPLSQGHRWAEVGFSCDQRRLGAAAPALAGWWRRTGDFVLTAAATRERLRGIEIIE